MPSRPNHLLLAVVLLLHGGIGRAQGTAPPESAGEWQTGAGVSLVSVPRYLGADRRLTLLLPSFEARRADGLFLSLDKGIGFETPVAEAVRSSFGLAVDLDARKSKDDVRFNGLPDVKEAVALRLGVDAEVGGFSWSATLQSRLAKRASAGSTLVAEASYGLTDSPAFQVSAGATVKFMDGRYAGNFLSVSAAQSAASGLPVYAAGAGLQSAGPFVQGLFSVAGDWTVFTRVSASRLQRAAAGSPLVRRKTDEVLVVSATRPF